MSSSSSLFSTNSSMITTTVQPSTSTSLDRSLTFIPLFSGTLSILGASIILYNILSDPQRRCKSPYFRIMLGLAISDIPFALSRMASTFAAPSGTPGLYYASGSQLTCSIQGFFEHFGMIGPLYTACLCVHYLLVIKYSKSDECIAKYFEPYMHMLSIGYPLIGAVVSVSLGLYKSNPHTCTYEIHPHHPSTLPSRYSQSLAFVWIFLGSGLIISFAILVCSLVIIYYTVWNRERTMNRRLSFSQHPLAQSTHLTKQTQAVKKQAYLYFISFVLIWGFGSAYRVIFMIETIQQQVYISSLLILSQLFNPMQGLFHSIIYVWPRYIKSREEHSNKSFGWLLYDAMVTTTREKNKRRQSLTLQRHYEKRRRLSMNEINTIKTSFDGIESHGTNTGDFDVVEEGQNDETNDTIIMEVENVRPSAETAAGVVVPLELLNDDKDEGKWEDY